MVKAPVFVISEEGTEKREWKPPGFSRDIKQIVEKAHEKILGTKIPLGASESMVTLYTCFIDTKNPLEGEEEVMRQLKDFPDIRVFVDTSFLQECKSRKEGEPGRNCSPCSVRHTYFLVGRFLLVNTYKRKIRLKVKLIGEDEGDRLHHLLGKGMKINSEESFETLVVDYVEDLNVTTGIQARFNSG